MNDPVSICIYLRITSVMGLGLLALVVSSCAPMSEEEGAVIGTGTPSPTPGAPFTPPPTPTPTPAPTPTITTRAHEVIVRVVPSFASGCPGHLGHPDNNYAMIDIQNMAIQLNNSDLSRTHIIPLFQIFSGSGAVVQGTVLQIVTYYFSANFVCNANNSLHMTRWPAEGTSQCANYYNVSVHDGTHTSQGKFWQSIPLYVAVKGQVAPGNVPIWDFNGCNPQ